MAAETQKNQEQPAPAAPEISKAPGISRIVQKIDEMIATGQLVPGQRLIEAELMLEMNASRGMIREALRFLAGDGVVELLPNRGARVTKLDAVRLGYMLQVIPGLFRTGMKLLVSRPIPAHVREELMMAVANIGEAVQSGDVVEIMERTADYNETITGNCGNPYVVDLLRKIHLRHYIKQLALVWDRETLLRSHDMYSRVTEHLLAGDAESAFHILEPHIDVSAEKLIRD